MLAPSEQTNGHEKENYYMKIWKKRCLYDRQIYVVKREFQLNQTTETINN